MNVKTIDDDEEDEGADVSDHSDEEQNQKCYITITTELPFDCWPGGRLKE